MRETSGAGTCSSSCGSSLPPMPCAATSMFSHGRGSARLPAAVRAGRHRLLVLHDISQLEIDPLRAGYSAVVFGHSQRASVESREGVLFLNPGSVGPRRFGLPVTMARLQVTGTTMRPTLLTLA